MNQEHNELKIADGVIEYSSQVNIADCTLVRLFSVWFKIGATSFGGGAITQYLIQEQFIYKHHWITEEMYTNIIGMCQITPGINILAYTIIIGRQLAGLKGVFISLLGLLLPSAGITVAITALYLKISDIPRIQSALHTMFAAIFGISLATNWRNIKPIIKANHQHSHIALFSVLLLLIGSGLLYTMLHPPVAVLYLLGGTYGAILYACLLKNKRR